MTRRFILGVCALGVVFLALLIGCGDDQRPGEDTIPPAPVSDLAVRSATRSSATLGWTAPGDNGARGRASEYDLRYSLGMITEEKWPLAFQAEDEPQPGLAGSDELFTVEGLEPDTVYYFGIESVDGADNRSGLSNIVACTTSVTGDFTPPDVVGNLHVKLARATRVTLSWIAPGDDGSVGSASQYDLRYATSAETGWWESATRASVPGEPSPSGGIDSCTIRGLEPETLYYFALKSADDAGNWSELSDVVSGTTMRVCAPTLTVMSSAFGSRMWSGWFPDAEEYEVPRGGSYDFAILGEPLRRGVNIAGYAYGWDLSDVNNPATDPDGIGGWTPWSMTGMVIHAEFTEAGDRYLYVKCKDDDGAITLATIHFRVVSFGEEKELCFVDDWRCYPQFPSPSQNFGEPFDDAFWQKMLEGYDYGQGWDGLVWDEWTAPDGEEMPPLEFLSRFKVVVWSINDNRMIAPSAKSAWFTMNELNEANVLAIYLSGTGSGGEKGKVWVYGRGMIESTVLPNGGVLCDYPYAVLKDGSPSGCRITEGCFAFDYLHIRGDYEVAEPYSGGARVNMFTQHYDWMQYVYLNSDHLPIEGYTTPPASELYPTLPPRLEPDLSKTKVLLFLHFEVIELPSPKQEHQLLFYDPSSGGETRLIPLYRFRAGSTTSKADGKYCGFRYVPQGLSDHGDIVYFFFQMYPIYDDQARATAKVVLSDWFGLPDPD